ncbi:MAG: hypothetical protein WDO13_19655 [Verrucomicrobiota bacterium]
MNQNVPANLMAGGDGSGTFDFFGMAKVSLVDALDEAHLIAPPAPAGPAAPAAAPRDNTPFHETQIVFAKNPQQTVIDTDSDARSGYEVTLDAPAGSSGYEAIVSGPSGVTQALPVKGAGGGWTNLFGDGDPILFRVAKYWPDFAMRDGLPVSLSNQPNNPAALVQITGPSKLLPPAPPKPPAPPPPMPKGLAMRIALAKEPGRIVYEMEREGKIEARGGRGGGRRDSSRLVEVGGEGGRRAAACRAASRHEGIYGRRDADDGGLAAAGHPRLPGAGRRPQGTGGMDSLRLDAGAFRGYRFRADRFWAARHPADLLDRAGEFPGAARRGHRHARQLHQFAALRRAVDRPRGARHRQHEFARDVPGRFLALAARLELQIFAGQLESRQPE